MNFFPSLLQFFFASLDCLFRFVSKPVKPPKLSFCSLEDFLQWKSDIVSDHDFEIAGNTTNTNTNNIIPQIKKEKPTWYQTTADIILWGSSNPARTSLCWSVSSSHCWFLSILSLWVISYNIKYCCWHNFCSEFTAPIYFIDT